MTDAPPSPARHWHFDVVCTDGEEVHVRPVLVDDRALVEGLRSRCLEAAPADRADPIEGGASAASLDDLLVGGADRVALGAHRDGELLVLVGAHHRASPEAHADVTLLAAEGQGRGVLSTLLLQYLTAAGRERGWRHLVAELPGTATEALDALRDAGYRPAGSTAGGTVRLAIELQASTPAPDAPDEQRERLTEVRAVDRLLRPKSVAVIGASSRHGSLGHRLFVNLLAGEFDGPVHPVNDHAAHVASVAAHGSVHDVPGEIDLAVVAVPAPAVPAVVEQCGDKGVKALVVLSAGLDDTDPTSVELGRRTLEAAERAGIRLLGPGSLGVANLRTGLDASVAPVRPSPGRVALLGQSGPLTVAALARCERAGLGLSSWAALGARSDLSGNDLLEYWEDDPDTDVVLLYVEAVGAPRTFARVARRVAVHTPIVAVRAPGSGVAGWDDGDGLYHQCGVVPVDTVDEMVDAARLLTAAALPASGRVAVMSDVGSAALIASHLCRGRGLETVALGHQAAAHLADVVGAPVGERAAVSVGPEAASGTWERAAAVLVDETSADVLVVVLGASPPERAATVVEEVRRAVEGTSATVLGIDLSGGLDAVFEATADHAAIALYPSAEAAGAALGRVARYAEWRADRAGERPAPTEPHRATARRLVADVLADAPGDASGRVVAGADVAAELLACFGVSLEPVGPDAVAPDGVPLAVAVEEHPVFGAVVVLARAGVPTALAGDRSVHVAPLGRAEAHAMVRALRASPLVLAGSDGDQAVGGLVELLEGVGAMVDELPEVVGLDLGPVVLSGGRVHAPPATLTLRAVRRGGGGAVSAPPG